MMADVLVTKLACTHTGIQVGIDFCNRPTHTHGQFKACFLNTESLFFCRKWVRVGNGTGRLELQQLKSSSEDSVVGRKTGAEGVRKV